MAMILTGQVRHPESTQLCSDLFAEDQADGKSPQNKQGMHIAAVRVWQSITRLDTKSLLKDVGRRLQSLTTNLQPNIEYENSI